MAIKKEPLSIKARALRYLSLREHTRAELEKKLLKINIENNIEQDNLNIINKILDEFESKGFLSDERAASAIINQKSSKLGNMRVLNEMRQKGVPDNIIQEAKENLIETELERAKNVWAKKFNSPANTPQEKAKQLRFLASRGFSANIAYKIIGGHYNEDNEEDY